MRSVYVRRLILVVALMLTGVFLVPGGSTQRPPPYDRRVGLHARNRHDTPHLYSRSHTGRSGSTSRQIRGRPRRPGGALSPEDAAYLHERQITFHSPDFRHPADESLLMESLYPLATPAVASSSGGMQVQP